MSSRLLAAVSLIATMLIALVSVEARSTFANTKGADSLQFEVIRGSPSDPAAEGRVSIDYSNHSQHGILAWPWRDSLQALFDLNEWQRARGSF